LLKLDDLYSYRQKTLNKIIHHSDTNGNAYPGIKLQAYRESQVGEWALRRGIWLLQARATLFIFGNRGYFMAISPKNGARRAL
jgi:hypothetical protein